MLLETMLQESFLKIYVPFLAKALCRCALVFGSTPINPKSWDQLTSPQNVQYIQLVRKCHESLHLWPSCKFPHHVPCLQNRTTIVRSLVALERLGKEMDETAEPHRLELLR